MLYEGKRARLARRAITLEAMTLEATTLEPIMLEVKRAAQQFEYSRLNTDVRY